MVELELIFIAQSYAMLLLKVSRQFHNTIIGFREINVLKHILSETGKGENTKFLMSVWNTFFATFKNTNDMAFCD
ncbi:MAG: hypothetical protein HG456_002965 [candidate division SR1 bacterium]|nr:hypothetical protein [candidate division SR1 bacterium]